MFYFKGWCLHFLLLSDFMSVWFRTQKKIQVGFLRLVLGYCAIHIPSCLSRQCWSVSPSSSAVSFQAAVVVNCSWFARKLFAYLNISTRHLSTACYYRVPMIWLKIIINLLQLSIGDKGIILNSSLFFIRSVLLTNRESACLYLKFLSLF